VTCAEAIAIPAKRPALLSAVIVLVSLGMMSTESRRSRREREALAARLATLSRDDVPANVIDLLLAGKKIQAIRSYRELAGTSQREAKTRIDSL
jgi:ribosomal protein L7/L12